jgi:hypothetical protein
MTVADLIKKLQQCQENETIVSVHIRIWDGSIYNDAPMLKQKGFPQGFAHRDRDNR